MVDEANAGNKVSGGVTGTVVQAGTIHRLILPRNRQAPPRPWQLPATVRGFAGRGESVKALDALLDADSAGSPVCLTLDGVAGVGKTALAVWWAHRVHHRFPDGALFAELGGHAPDAPRAPAVVLTSFLQAFGVTDEVIPREIGALTGLYRSVLGQRRVLVLLDNAADAGQVRPLLPGSQGSLVVVTSRNALNGLVVTEGARRLCLDVLEPADATALVTTVIGSDRATAEPAAVAELVRLCGRLPLALRVAASRIASRRHTRVADVVEDLAVAENRLDALRVAKDEATAVRTVFDWSYARLPAAEARLFRLLGLHPAPEFDANAAAAFAGTDPTAARRILDGLAESHMVEEIAHRRYRCHDLLHLYAASRAESDETATGRLCASAAGLSWYAQAATDADKLVFPAQPGPVADLGPVRHRLVVADRARAWTWLTTECSTLFAALKEAFKQELHQISLALAAGFRFLALQPGALWPVRLEAETYGLAAARAAGHRTAEAVFLRRRADTRQMLGHWCESDSDLREAAVLAVELGDSALRGEVLCGLGRNLKLQRRYAAAQACYEQALPLVRGVGTRYVEAVVECNLSQLSGFLGQHDRALAHAERELALRQEQGEPRGEGYAWHDLAVARQGLGWHEVAAEAGERSIAAYRAAVGADEYLARALETTAISLRHTGEHARAAEYLAEAKEIHDRYTE
ncbi:NB-ARC domain-containing protein [Amycolatopsis sp. Hca4]|uniref:ATP-binding protein n=1 Tax=Amycolatopsis sp. Hca4 TaxID=2742131 RepID=UPI001590B9E8|nr:tetratricopeptide repeat protein [Amycolatopsis sp. Hca4]QKV80625.1 hypothetical protein HUT10_47760 [Amycolatopsis sp. Hca4]